VRNFPPKRGENRLSCRSLCFFWGVLGYRGAWTATFYETNRQEPKIYTLTGDLPSSIVINPDSTFTLTAYSVRFVWAWRLLPPSASILLYFYYFYRVLVKSLQCRLRRATVFS
jgi:hypothetical protein